MNIEEAQQLLNDGFCPQCDELVYDCYDGETIYFECFGRDKHHYKATWNQEIGIYFPYVDGTEDFIE